MGGPQYYFTGTPAGIQPPVTVLGRGTVAVPRPEPLTVLATLDDVRAATRQAAAQAQRLLSIYTLDLEPEVYEQPAFLDLVRNFVLGRSYARIRILTQKPVAYGSPHKLAVMRRRLSGHIDIRTVDPQFASRTSSLLIADSRAIVYRAQASSWEGVAGFDQPPIARHYLQEFDEMWQASVPKY